MSPNPEALQAILNALADPVFVKDRQHRWIFMNDAMCSFMGKAREELIGRSDFDFFPAREAQVFWAHDEIVFESGETDVNEESFTDGYGVTHHIVTKKCLCRSRDGLSIVGIIRDITRERLLESHMLQMHKMEALGQMARGIAHDFNNLLSIITGYSQLVLNELPSSNHLRRDLEEVLAAGRSAAALTRQILTFSRNTVLEPRDVGLNEVVRNLAPMLRSLLGDRVELEFCLREGPDAVHADPQQLAQVLVNLALNARDAMPEGGTLFVATREPVPEELPPGASGEASDFVLLTVADTGSGMDEATRAHVFEPFFTTKKRGQGAGLGLSLVYGVVTASGGYVHVTSQPQEGSCFWILLPLASARRAQDKPGGAATVLVVEDEKALRSLVSRVLEARGHHVLAAEDAAAALELARTHPGALDLLIADVSLPGTTGPALAEEIRRFRPDLRLLFMSGFPEEEALPGPLLAKPFTPSALEAEVEALLGPVGGPG